MTPSETEEAAHKVLDPKRTEPETGKAFEGGENNNTIEEDEAEADVDDKEENQMVSADHSKIKKKIKYFKDKRQHNGYSSSGMEDQRSSVQHHSLLQYNHRLTSSDEEKLISVTKTNKGL